MCSSMGFVVFGEKFNVCYVLGKAVLPCLVVLRLFSRSRDVIRWEKLNNEATQSGVSTPVL